MVRELAKGYKSEVDNIDEETWCRLLGEFDGANIYQTWSYGEVMSGRRNVSHVVLRKEGEIVAIALARIVRLPVINVGIAYVRWGPLWRHRRGIADAETFCQAVRALRNEYVGARGLVLRVFPNICGEEVDGFARILGEEGFAPVSSQMRDRTILIDLIPSLEELRTGIKRNWKRNLKVAEEAGLEITEGSSDELFEAFIAMYKETVARKQFTEPNDINQFRMIQANLPEKQKMQILLCRSGEGPCAGLVWNALGEMAIELFAATSEAGLASRGSYLLRWKLVEKLKRGGFSTYDLNGINPITNPGGYKFKSELAGKNGKDVYFLGRFDSHANGVSYWCVQLGESLKQIYRTMISLLRTGHDKGNIEFRGGNSPEGAQ